jgi:hypothetical protein
MNGETALTRTTSQEKTVIAKATAPLPVGTESEEWRLMSARIAWLLWSSPARAGQPSELQHARITWDSRAPDFRADVRLALRMLEREGIRFRNAYRDTVEPDGQDWRDQTARLAWFFWLRNNRRTVRIPVEHEATVWQVEADSYRGYVRDVVRQLAGEGIRLVRQV